MALVGFRFAGNSTGDYDNLVSRVVVAEEADAITHGSVLDYANTSKDAMGLCASGGKPAAIAILPMGTTTVTGDEDDTTVAPITARLIQPGDYFEVAQGNNTDANTYVGATLDLNATASGVTTDSNHDVVVYAHDRTQKLLYVKFLNVRN